MLREGEGRVPVLELANISKHFGAIQAVNDVSLSLEAGEVVGLMGDNGAGKSTLVKMIAGTFRPSHGTMRLDGADRVIVMRRGRKVADKRIADSSPEEVTGLITGAIESA